MHIVFLNTFEKPGAGGGILSAQLSICEKQGIWSVLWLEDGQDGQNGEVPETWFEGTSWEEMIIAFRYGITKVMGAGYSPVIDGMLEDRSNAAGSQASMLQCYGEFNADEALFQSLREWRRARAIAEKKSAYLIATNRMLWMISAFIPQTEEELTQIPGWGRVKHEAYGMDVLGITKGMERTTAFPLHWVKDHLDPEVYTQWLYKQKEEKYKGMMDRQQAKKRILTFVKQGRTLEQLEGELELSRRELLGRIEQMEEEGYDFEALIERELAIVPESEQQLILDSLSRMGDKYLKPLLKQVYGSSEANQLNESLDVLYERLRLVRLRFRRGVSKKVV